MSNIALLPLYEVHAGIQANEDWSMSLFVARPDGVTPIDLTGITFTATVGSYTPISVSGDATGLVVIAASAAQKSAWADGYHPMTVLATASDGKRDLTARSFLTIGSPRSVVATQLDTGSEASISNITSAVFASLAALPSVQRGDAIPAAGKAYINSSGYLVIAQ